MRALMKWNGDEIIANLDRAAREAIDETTAAAAEDAKSSHAYSSRSGRLEGETISEPAKAQGDRVTGSFGTTQVRGFYGLFEELKRPFLRPAADRQFPKLAERIREKS